MKAAYDPNHVTYFAQTDFRNQQTKFGIKSRDRTRHMYVIGKSGVGKSTLLENMAIQDIAHGEGVAVLDPHGSFAEKMLDYIPAERIKDVIYFAPFDTNYPISFNVLEDVGEDKRHFVASGLMSTFKKIWVDAWSARMEYILNNILLALLEYPEATLLGVNRMLSDKTFREKVVANCTDPGVKAFWVEEFAKYGDRYMQEAGAAIQNKIGQFTANPLIRNIIGQPKSSFDIRAAMDEQKILIVNLSKGRIGEQNTSLLGSMIITKIYLAAMSRADATADRLRALPNFYFYVDEFQSFANESFANILSEARKYKLALIIAHQYIAQMEESVRDAVFGNVGTSVSFRVGPLDAELLEKVYAPQFTANDIINLGMAQIYLSLMIDDMGSAPFSARTLPPLPHPELNYRNDVIEWVRERYAHPREEVEQNIRDWYAKDASPVEEKSQKKIRFADENPAPQKPVGASAPYNPGGLLRVVKKENKPFAKVATMTKKPLAKIFNEPQVKREQKREEQVVQKQVPPQVQHPVEIDTTSPLGSFLAAIDEKKPEPVQAPESPFAGEKPLRESIPPVRVHERGPTEKNKDLLRAALQNVLPRPATQPVSTAVPPPARPSQLVPEKKVPPQDVVTSPSAEEISTKELQKILE